MAKTLESRADVADSLSQEGTGAVPQAEAHDGLLEAAAGARGMMSLDVLMDVPVTLSVEVGRSRLSIREVLTLHEGAVVSLDRHAGELLGVFVNGALVAKGEVVIVNEAFGIRLTEVVSPAERMGKLR
jgi:flagellar motor switch protein FliN/FliY